MHVLVPCVALTRQGQISQVSTTWVSQWLSDKVRQWSSLYPTLNINWNIYLFHRRSPTSTITILRTQTGFSKPTTIHILWLRILGCFEKVCWWHEILRKLQMFLISNDCLRLFKAIFLMAAEWRAIWCCCWRQHETNLQSVITLHWRHLLTISGRCWNSTTATSWYILAIASRPLGYKCTNTRKTLPPERALSYIVMKMLQGYFSGGAGYVLSQAAVRRLVQVPVVVQIRY